MDTLLGVAVVGVWIAISVTALMRAFGSRGGSPDSSPNRHTSVACSQQSHRERAAAHGSRPSGCC
jgi:hypothetical protein